MSHRKRVYIAGPMTGYVDYNRDAFYRAAQHLFEMGFEPVNPADLDAADGSDTDIKPHAWYMRRDIKALLTCDHIYLLPGWRWSKGASLEATVAEGCEISRLHDTDPTLWRTFEGQPEDGGLRYEVSPILQIPEGYATQPAEPCTSGAVIFTPAEDGGDRQVNDHPRFGTIPAEPEETCGDVQHAAKINETFTCTETPGHSMPHSDGSAWWEPLLDIEVDDTLPPHTMRLETPVGSIDFTVHEHPTHGIILQRKGEHRLPNQPEEGLTSEPRYFLDHADKPQPGDEFPNVGYVRRMKALLQGAWNHGGRRSA